MWVREQREIFTKGWTTGKKEGEGVGVGWGNKQTISRLFPHPSPTVHSNSDIAGRINDCEPVTLSRPNKTPALQASDLWVVCQLLPIVVFKFGPSISSKQAYKHLLFCSQTPRWRRYRGSHSFKSGWTSRLHAATAELTLCSKRSRSRTSKWRTLYYT